MMIIEIRDKGGKKIKMRKNKIFVSLIMNFYYFNYFNLL